MKADETAGFLFTPTLLSFFKEARLQPSTCLLHPDCRISCSGVLPVCSAVYDLPMVSCIWQQCFCSSLPCLQVSDVEELGRPTSGLVPELSRFLRTSATGLFNRAWFLCLMDRRVLERTGKEEPGDRFAPSRCRHAPSLGTEKLFFELVLCCL